MHEKLFLELFNIHPYFEKKDRPVATSFRQTFFNGLNIICVLI